MSRLAKADSLPRVRSIPQYTAPFPPLQLREQDCATLRAVTDNLIAESVLDFERFSKEYGQGRMLPRTQWKMIHAVDDFRLFLEKKEANTSTGDGAHGARGNALATIVGCGTVPGSIADSLYGVITTTVDQTRIRSKYDKDPLHNFAILATVDEPTTEDPFRSMTVRWYVKTIPTMLHTLLKHEDSTVIEASGVTTTATGEVFGYHLIHTIELPGLPALKEYRRVDLSTVTLWRQHDSRCVQAYLKTFADVKTMLAPAALTTFAQLFGNVTANYPHVGRMKKLSWMLRCKASRGVSAAEEQAAAQIMDCVSCGTSLVRVLGPRKHRCVLCRLPICSSCGIKHKLLALSSSTDIKEYHVRLCGACWDIIVSADTVQVARNDLVGFSSINSGRGCVTSEVLSLSIDESSSHSGSESQP